MTAFRIACLAGIALSGCDLATQVTYQISASAELEAEGQSVAIEVVQQEGDLAFQQSLRLRPSAGAAAEASFPIFVPIVPLNDNASRRPVLQASLIGEGGIELSSLRRETVFAEGEHLRPTLTFGNTTSGCGPAVELPEPIMGEASSTELGRAVSETVVPGTELTLGGQPDIAWLVLVSGGIRSSISPLTRLSMKVNNNVVSVLSGALRRPWSSVYFVEPNGMEHSVSLNYFSPDGELGISATRVIAVPLPAAWADFHGVRPGTVELGDSVLTIGQLSFTPCEAGRYFVLASCSLGPEIDLVPVGGRRSLWLTDPSGAVSPSVRSTTNAPGVAAPLIATSIELDADRAAVIAMQGESAMTAKASHCRIVAFRAAALPGFDTIFDAEEVGGAEPPSEVASLTTARVDGSSQALVIQSVVGMGNGEAEVEFGRGRTPFDFESGENVSITSIDLATLPEDRNTNLGIRVSPATVTVSDRAIHVLHLP